MCVCSYYVVISTSNICRPNVGTLGWPLDSGIASAISVGRCRTMLPASIGDRRYGASRGGSPYRHDYHHRHHHRHCHRHHHRDRTAKDTFCKARAQPRFVLTSYWLSLAVLNLVTVLATIYRYTLQAPDVATPWALLQLPFTRVSAHLLCVHPTQIFQTFSRCLVSQRYLSAVR